MELNNGPFFKVQRRSQEERFYSLREAMDKLQGWWVERALLLWNGFRFYGGGELNSREKALLLLCDAGGMRMKQQQAEGLNYRGKR